MISRAALRLTQGSSWLFRLECLNYFRIVLQSDRLQPEIFRRARVSSDPGSCFLKCPCVPGACLCACVLENLTSVLHGLAILVWWKESYYPEHQEHQYEKTGKPVFTSGSLGRGIMVFSLTDFCCSCLCWFPAQGHSFSWLPHPISHM